MLLLKKHSFRHVILQKFDAFCATVDSLSSHTAAFDSAAIAAVASAAAVVDWRTTTD